MKSCSMKSSFFFFLLCLFLFFIYNFMDLISENGISSKTHRAHHIHPHLVQSHLVVKFPVAFFTAHLNSRIVNIKLTLWQILQVQPTLSSKKITLNSKQERKKKQSRFFFSSIFIWFSFRDTGPVSTSFYPCASKLILRLY